MSDNYLRVLFSYREGNKEEIAGNHTSTFEESSKFVVSKPFVKASSWTVEVANNEIPYITGMSDLDNYSYEDHSVELDLLYSPLIYYYLEDIDVLDFGTNTSAERESLELFIELVITGYQATDKKPLVVYAEVPELRYRMGKVNKPPFTARSLAEDEYEYLSWLTIFTPPMVERYGRETLLSAPAWKVEELDDGAILIVCHDDVSDWKDDCRAVADHIGLPSYEDL